MEKPSAIPVLALSPHACNLLLTNLIIPTTSHPKGAGFNYARYLSPAIPEHSDIPDIELREPYQAVK